MATQLVTNNLHDYLVASSSIAATVGSSNAARVHVNKIPQEDGRPFIWLQRSGRNRERLLDGTPVGPIETTYDIECIHTTAGNADGLADDVTEWLEALRPGSTMGSDVIRGSEVSDQSDDYVPRNARDDGLHLSSLRFSVWHTT